MLRTKWNTGQCETRILTINFCAILVYSVLLLIKIILYIKIIIFIINDTYYIRFYRSDMAKIILK